LYFDESPLTVFGTHVEESIGEIAGRVASCIQFKKILKNEMNIPVPPSDW